jgi:formylglycine-generating enzyme required for sulfatase activity
MGSNPSRFKSVSGQDTSRFPVECVSWEDCQEFLRKLNAEHGLEGFRYRLPTEAEWEYACRAGTVTPFWFGGELNGQQANCNGNYPYQTGKGPYLARPSVVGSYGANPFGVYDQHGQVWEWCGDWYDGHYGSSSPVEDPQGASSGSSRVLRGGSWNYYAVLSRSACRNSSEPSNRFYRIGFRVLCELS